MEVLLFGITGTCILYQRLWRTRDLCQLGSVSDHEQYDKMHEMILYSYSGEVRLVHSDQLADTRPTVADYVLRHKSAKQWD